MKAIDLTGQRFGKLQAVQVQLATRGKERRWLCYCDCGGQSYVTTDNLRSGNSKACGGCRPVPNGGYRHGHKSARYVSPTYHSWTAMRRRALNPAAHNSAYYSGRGIDVDPRWEDFKVFLADMGERPKGKTLDRRDNDRGYWPDNCRWATATEQTRNRRNSRTMTRDGRTLPVIEWAKELGVPYITLIQRLNRGGAAI